jgi:hypothetical protein
VHQNEWGYNFAKFLLQNLTTLSYGIMPNIMPVNELQRNTMRDMLKPREATDRLTIISKEASEVLWRKGVTLILDRTSTIPLWRKSIGNFVHELRVLDVPLKIVGLSTDDPEQAKLYDLESKEESEISTQDLTGEDDPGIILTLSPGITPAWRSGKVPSLLQELGDKKFVGSVSLTREHNWRGTVIGKGIQSRVDTVINPDAQSNRELLDKQSADARMDMTDETTALIPLLRLDRRYLDHFTNGITERSGQALFTVNFPLDRMSQDFYEDQATETEELDPLDRIMRFRAYASPNAFKLAIIMAAAPVDLEVEERIRKEMLPGADENDFAEIVLSGLVRLKENNEDSVPYDFKPGVRENLFAGGLRTDTFHALGIATDVLMTRYPDEQGFELLNSGIFRGGGIEDLDSIVINERTLPLVRICSLSLNAMGGSKYWEYSRHLDELIKRYEDTNTHV